MSADSRAHLVLGVPLSAGQEEIRYAFKRRALAVHPDKGGTSAAFLEVMAAFEALTTGVPRQRPVATTPDCSGRGTVAKEKRQRQQEAAARRPAGMGNKSHQQEAAARATDGAAGSNKRPHQQESATRTTPNSFVETAKKQRREVDPIAARQEEFGVDASAGHAGERAGIHGSSQAPSTEVHAGDTPAQASADCPRHEEAQRSSPTRRTQAPPPNAQAPQRGADYSAVPSVHGRPFLARVWSLLQELPREQRFEAIESQLSIGQRRVLEQWASSQRAKPQTGESLGAAVVATCSAVLVASASEGGNSDSDADLSSCDESVLNSGTSCESNADGSMDDEYALPLAICDVVHGGVDQRYACGHGNECDMSYSDDREIGEGSVGGKEDCNQEDNAILDIDIHDELADDEANAVSSWSKATHELDQEEVMLPFTKRSDSNVKDRLKNVVRLAYPFVDTNVDGGILARSDTVAVAQGVAPRPSRQRYLFHERSVDAGDALISRGLPNGDSGALRFDPVPGKRQHRTVKKGIMRTSGPEGVAYIAVSVIQLLRLTSRTTKDLAQVLEFHMVFTSVRQRLLVSVDSSRVQCMKMESRFKAALGAALTDHGLTMHDLLPRCRVDIPAGHWIGRGNLSTPYCDLEQALRAWRRLREARVHTCQGKRTLKRSMFTLSHFGPFELQRTWERICAAYVGIFKDAGKDWQAQKLRLQKLYDNRAPVREKLEQEWNLRQMAREERCQRLVASREHLAQRRAEKQQRHQVQAEKRERCSMARAERWQRAVSRAAVKALARERLAMTSADRASVSRQRRASLPSNASSDAKAAACVARVKRQLDKLICRWNSCERRRVRSATRARAKTIARQVRAAARSERQAATRSHAETVKKSREEKRAREERWRQMKRKDLTMEGYLA